MNKYVKIGREINQTNKDDGRWMLPYRDFVRMWQERISNDHFGNDTEKYEAFLLAIHGYDGTISFLSAPDEWVHE
jgi:hypothetical protein